MPRITAPLRPTAGPVARSAPGGADLSSLPCAVRLIDRRTGQTHRVNGSPLQMITRTPDVAVAELLSGRDPAVWEARVEPIGSVAARGRGAL